MRNEPRCAPCLERVVDDALGPAHQSFAVSTATSTGSIVCRVRKNPLEPLPRAGVWPTPHRVVGPLPAGTSTTGGVRGSRDNVDTVEDPGRSTPKRDRPSTWPVVGPAVFLGLTVDDIVGASWPR